MSRLLALLAALCVLLTASPAGAEDVTETPPEPAPATEASSVLPLDAGVPAPFDGFLVAEARFMEYLALQVRLREMTLTIEAVRETARQTVQGLSQQLEAAIVTNEPGWFSRNGVVIGFVLGVVGAGLVVWAAVSVLDANNGGT